MNPNTDPTFDVLRELPTEVTLEQVGAIVAAFPLAAASGSWLSNFNFNSILMTTAGTILVASSMYMLTATQPVAAPLAVIATTEIAPEDAVVWTPPKEEPVVRLEPIATKLSTQEPQRREPIAVPTPEPIALEPEPKLEPAKAMVWVSDESRTYDVAGFTGVKVLGSMDVVIEQGPFHVQADGNPDLAELFNLEVIGRTLNISARESKGDERQRSCKNASVLTVRMPSLERIELFGSGAVHASDFTDMEDLTLNLKGSGDIHLNTFTGVDVFMLTLAGSGDIVGESMVVRGKTEVDLSGSGDIRLSGSTAQLQVKLVGSGDVDAHGLVSGSCKVAVVGSGDVMVNCTDTIDQCTTGSGEVHESGNAGKVRGDRTY